MRFRNIVLGLGSVLTVAVLMFSDPNGGALTAATLIQLATALIAVGFAHVARKALFDYIDLQEIFTKAKSSAVGAGLVFLGSCLVISALLGLFGGQVHAATVDTYVPTNAKVMLPILQIEKDRLWADHPNQKT